MIYKYYNPNPHGKSVGDCSVRALCRALGEPWAAVYAEQCVRGLSMGDMPSSNAVWGAILRSKGFVKHIIPDSCPDCYTFGDFADDHPTGVYVIGTGSHVATIIGGTIYDSWDSSGEIPIFYYTKGRE